MSDIVYLKLTGEEQGDISVGCGTTASVGNRRQIGHEDEIFIFSLATSITSTGKGSQPQGLCFCKLIDKCSPLLINTINNNEQLYVEFYFYRINPSGRWERYYYIQLRGAYISRIETLYKQGSLDTETITVGYEYILCQHLIANTEYSYLVLPASYNRLFVPPVNGLQTLNSKAVGSLLAAGGIYNGNAEEFHKTAEQLGGDAPAGYNQVMDHKGLLIAGTSVVAGLTMGRMRFPELDEAGYFGARGTVSGRTFDPELAGGPIEHLTTEGVIIEKDGVATVEKHISRFQHDPANDIMIERLKKITKGEIVPDQFDLNYYTHECREYQRYCNLGWETGEPEGIEGYNLWNHAHAATLEDYRITDAVLFHPEALKNDFKN